MSPRQREQIKRKLESAALKMEEALALARQAGWTGAFGFVAGEGDHATVAVVESYEIRDKHNSSPPEESFIHARADGWDSGAW